VTTDPTGDYNAYFFDLRLTAPPLLRNLTLTGHGRFGQQLMKGIGYIDVTNAIADITSAYSIGLVQLSLQYQFNYFDQATSTLSHNLFFRLSRQFSI